MINVQTNNTNKSMPRFMLVRSKVDNKIQVWAEPKRGGGYAIFCGVPGTDVKTFAGAAMSRDTLDYNIRKAKMKFGIPLN